MIETPLPKAGVFALGHEPAARVSTRASGRRGLMVVDDHELVRWGVRALIQSQSRLTSQPVDIFEASSLASALTVFSANQADIDLVLFDLGLPDTRGLSGLVVFLEQYPSASVAVISGDCNRQTAEEAMVLGAQAYLKKTGDLAEVIDYLQHQGLMGANDTNQSVSGTRTGHWNKTRELTARQNQILQWILQGKSNREIGELAFLAEGTVKNHVSTLLLHFGAKSRAQLISALC